MSNNQSMRVKLIDSPMGTGKTTYIQQYIESLDPFQKVIYITPFLSECQRIIDTCKKKKFTMPDKSKGRGQKSAHLLKMIKDGINIASTHALFSSISDEIITALRQSDYILVLDEAFDVVTKFDLFKNDKEFSRCTDKEKSELTRKTIDALLNKKCIEIHDDGSVEWIDDKYPEPKYYILKNLCDREMLYVVNGVLFLWSFPCDVFLPGIFDEIYILTYQFEYQLQSYYFRFFGIQFDKYHIENWGSNYELIKTENNDYEKEWIKNLSKLINIYEGSANKKGIFYRKNRGMGAPTPIETALSKTWYSENQHQIPELKKGVETFFKNCSSAKGTERMWTCFKYDKRLFQGKFNSSRNWLAFNSRSTNDYRNRKAIAYLVNRYIDPFFISFFAKKDIYLSKDAFALSEMLQFICRSAVREGEGVTIYIPSERMRELLKEYLNGVILIVDVETHMKELQEEELQAGMYQIEQEFEYDDN